MIGLIEELYSSFPVYLEKKKGKLFKKQVCVILHGNLLQGDLSDKVIFHVHDFNGAFSPGMNC